MTGVVSDTHPARHMLYSHTLTHVESMMDSLQPGALQPVLVYPLVTTQFLGENTDWATCVQPSQVFDHTLPRLAERGCCMKVHAGVTCKKPVFSRTV